MVTLAALCLANNLDMHAAAEAELDRVWTKVEAIRAQQAAKPKHSPLPGYAETIHPDDEAVDRFAAQMKAKLAKARAKGRGGWDDPAQCSPDFLRALLHEHVAKGDPVDVANFCMMLDHYGALTSATPPEGQVAAGLEVAARWHDQQAATYAADVAVLQLAEADHARIEKYEALHSEHIASAAAIRVLDAAAAGMPS